MRKYDNDTIKKQLEQTVTLKINNHKVIKVISEKDMNTYLVKQGFKTAIKGYQYVKNAIILCNEDASYLNAITKRLYPTIANMYNDTPSKVERAIRHAIEAAGLDYANSEFISISVLKLTGRL